MLYFSSVDMLLYNLIEKPGFQYFVNALNPSYKIPSQKTVTILRVPNLYEEIKYYVRLILNKNKTTQFSFTTDCWTALENTPYIALTCH